MPNNPTIQAYNEMSGKYFEQTRLYDPTSELRDDLQIFLLHMKTNHPIVLDAGAGSCRDSDYLLHRGCRVEAIDLAYQLLISSKTFFPNALKRVMDVCQLGYRDNCFNGVWCSAVFVHLHSNDIRTALSEFYRVLKPNGVIHFSVKEGRGSSLSYLDDTKQLYREFHFYEVEDIERLVAQSRFRVVFLRTKIENDSSGNATSWIKCLAMKGV